MLFGRADGVLCGVTHSPHPSDWVKFFAALQYALASLGIMFANKIVLTSYDFDSFAFLTLCQVALNLRCPLDPCGSRHHPR